MARRVAMNGMARAKNQRFYQITGFKHPVPSVTSVLNVVAKPGIIHWEKHMALKSMAEQVQEICVVKEVPVEAPEEGGEGQQQAATRRVPAADQDLHSALQSTLFDGEWMGNVVKTAKGAARREMRKAGDLGSKAHNLFEVLALGKPIADDDERIVPLVEGFRQWQSAHPNLKIMDVEKVVFSERYQFAGTLDATAIDVGELLPKEEALSPLEAAQAACGLTRASALKTPAAEDGKTAEKETTAGGDGAGEKEREKGSATAAEGGVSKAGKPRVVVLDWKTSNATYNEYALQIAAYAKAYEEMTGVEVAEAWIVRFDKLKARYHVSKVADIDHAYQTFLSCLHLYHSLSGEFFAKDSEPSVETAWAQQEELAPEEVEQQRLAEESRRISLRAIERQRALRQIEELVEKTVRRKTAALNAPVPALPKEKAGLEEADESLIAALRSNQKVF